VGSVKRSWPVQANFPGFLGVSMHFPFRSLFSSPVPFFFAAVFVACSGRTAAQNFYLPTPYPTETVTPIPTPPPSLSPGDAFPVFRGIVVNPREMSAEERRKDIQRRYLLFRDLEDEWLSLADLTGKNNLVLLYFFSADSPWTAREMPFFLHLYSSYHEAGLQVVGISLDRRRETAQEIVREWTIPWPVVWEEDSWDSSLVAGLLVNSLPRNYLIGSDGTLRAMDLRGEDLEKAISLYLKKPARGVPPPRTEWEPLHPQPGAPFTLRYRPLQNSHRYAARMDVAMEPATRDRDWVIVPMQKETSGTIKGEMIWAATITFPSNQIRAWLYVGPSLEGLPVAKILDPFRTERVMVESATLERIRELDRQALEAEEKGEWFQAASLWRDLLRVRPVDPVMYGRGVIGVVRAATHDSKAGDPPVLVQQLRQLPMLLNRESAEWAVRETIEPGDETAIDPWIARGAVTLLYEVAQLTTETMTNSYLDTLGWALYKSGYPDRALGVVNRIVPNYLIGDPPLGLRKVLYLLETGDKEKAKELYRELVERSGRLMDSLPESKPLQDKIFSMEPELELIAESAATTATLLVPAPGDQATTPTGITGPLGTTGIQAGKTTGTVETVVPETESAPDRLQLETGPPATPVRTAPPEIYEGGIPVPGAMPAEAQDTSAPTPGPE